MHAGQLRLIGKLNVLLRSPRPLEGPAVIEQQTGMTGRLYRGILLLFACLYVKVCTGQQSCLATENFQEECDYLSDASAMFEGWFGRKVSAYCSQQFPGVIQPLIRMSAAVLYVWPWESVHELPCRCGLTLWTALWTVYSQRGLPCQHGTHLR